jgi:hypothetical protein
MDEVLDLVWSEVPIDRVSAKIGEWRIIQIGDPKTALCEKHVLDGSQETDLIARVLILCDVLLKALCDHSRIIRQRIEAQHEPQESQKTTTIVQLRSERLPSDFLG